MTEKHDTSKKKKSKKKINWNCVTFIFYKNLFNNPCVFIFHCLLVPFLYGTDVWLSSCVIELEVAFLDTVVSCAVTVFLSTPEPKWLYQSQYHDSFSSSAAWELEGHAHSISVSALGPYTLKFPLSPWITDITTVVCSKIETKLENVFLQENALWMMKCPGYCKNATVIFCTITYRNFEKKPEHFKKLKKKKNPWKDLNLFASKSWNFN